MPIDTNSSITDIVREYSRPDVHIGAGEDESPWVPFIENVYIRHLAFDVRGSSFANILWVKKGGKLGRHRHRGPVFACTLEGSWRYLEYDWVAGPGDFIYETPGLVHTLVTDHAQGVKLFGWLEGPIDFFNEQGQFVEQLDVWWFINHYETHCREHGIPINKQLYL